MVSAVNSEFTYDTNYVRAGGVPIVIWATDLGLSYKLPLIPVISITGINSIPVYLEAASIATLRFVRIVTNSSAKVGCIPRVLSKSALVAPQFIATAKP